MQKKGMKITVHDGPCMASFPSPGSRHTGIPEPSQKQGNSTMQALQEHLNTLQTATLHNQHNRQYVEGAKCAVQGPTTAPCSKGARNVDFDATMAATVTCNWQQLHTACSAHCGTWFLIRVMSTRVAVRAGLMSLLDLYTGGRVLPGLLHRAVSADRSHGL